LVLGGGRREEWGDLGERIESYVETQSRNQLSPKGRACNGVRGASDLGGERGGTLKRRKSGGAGGRRGEQVIALVEGKQTKPGGRRINGPSSLGGVIWNRRKEALLGKK